MKLPDGWDWKNPDYDWVFDQRVKRLQRLRANPEILPRLREFYAAHPAEFISDWGQTFDPRLADRGQRTVVPFVLFPRQIEFIEWIMECWRLREDGLCEKSRDMGITWLCVAFAAWMMIFIPGSVMGIGSRKEEYVDKLGDPKSIFWKVREFINLLPSEFQPPGWDAKQHAPFMKAMNPGNNSFIIGEAGDNVGRGNRTSAYILDEYAFFDRPDAVDAALSQTTNCRIYVSTVNGTGNPFYRRAHDGKTRKFVFDWRDDLRKDQAWYDKQRSILDPVIVAQEIDRNYTAAVANAFIQGDIVQAASRKGPMDLMPHGPIMVGVDVARFGDDRTVVTFRQGRVCLRQEVFVGLDTVAVAGRVRDLVKDYLNDIGQIAIDTVGVGAGVADVLRRDFGDLVEDVNSQVRMNDGIDYNLRAYMWRQMREWLKNGASIPNDNELISDLSALRYDYKGGELIIEGKRDAKKRGVKSPDRADSLALTFAIPPKQRDRVNDFMGGQSAQWAAIDDVVGY